MNNNKTHWKIVGILGITQITSWGSMFYAFSLLAPEIQHGLGWRAEVVFGAFSWSMLVAGLVSTPAGMLIDRFGGRFVMGAGSVICGTGLIMLSLVQSPLQYYAAWSVLGAGMALVLYEAAFATINREFLEGARTGISTLTLFAGFASTVFWPLTLKLNAIAGWRETYLFYGIAQFVLCLPLHLALPARTKQAFAAHENKPQAARNYSLKEVVRESTFWKLACAFAANAFVFSALSVHLIPLLHKLGHPVATVVLFAAFIGPMQVAGRIGEMVFARNTLPQTVGRITFAALPTALVALLLLGIHQWAIAAFCLLYGLSNGILTIVRGTVPQTLFGRENYGAIAGALAGPTLISQAAGPLVIAAIIEMQFSPNAVLTVLLLVSLLSLGFYLAAVRQHDSAATV
ncbi:MAG: transporter [Herminiimonas sp.]|nr:transporter [Herminiimonas sp.]